MLMGFVGLPISITLYWLMLRSKKEDPFPKGGLLRLLIAAVISVALSSILSLPMSMIVAIFRSGALKDLPGFIELIQNDPSVLKQMMENTDSGILSMTVRSIVDMFFSAGLLEEGLKYLTCRMAIRKEGMVRTWMDAVVAFAIVGITFELLENVAFGAGSDVVSTLLRALASAHFAFGVIMGYFHGKSLVTGKKRYRLLSFFVPLLYHTVANGLMASMSLSKINYVIGVASSISYIIAAIAAVIIVLHWQKNKTLDVPVLQKQDQA
ncbi:MAG: PrsW family intramembrane metalloprotease [Erysipelotrichaceae bacterium]|nr:PrsW family intramembrane metalloprotease [Erysipelotrichaceae bacterium]